MDKCTEAWNIIKEVVGSLSFELLKKRVNERNAGTSARMLELFAKDDHPWQQREFIEAHSKQTSARMLELVATGDHSWQQHEFIEAHSKQTSARMIELASKDDHPWQQCEFIEAHSKRQKGVLGITWTEDVDEAIMRMIKNGVSYFEIALELGNGLNRSDIFNRWTRHLTESSGIIKPAVKVGAKSRITWTEDVDEAIMRMKKDGVSYFEIALELGNGLKTNDILNRWTRHLKIVA